MIYRDKQTGRFVSKAKWKRSKAQGGTRYTRQVFAVGRGEQRKKRGARPPRRALPKIREYIISYTYSKTGRSLDVIATGATQEEAIEAAHTLLENDARARSLVTSGFKGWDERVFKGRKTKRPGGKAQFRGASEEGEDDED